MPVETGTLPHEGDFLSFNTWDNLFQLWNNWPLRHGTSHMVPPAHLTARPSSRRPRNDPKPSKSPPPAAKPQVGGLMASRYFLLPWVLSGILVSWVVADQRRWARAPGRRRWSSLATAERPRTAQGRPSFGTLDDGPRPRHASPEAQLMAVSHDGGGACWPRACVPRCAPTRLGHAAGSADQASSQAACSCTHAAL